MTKKLTLLLLASATLLYAGKGKVRVASDVQGAYIYVDGKKKAMTGEGFTSILLEEGEHTVKVSKEFKGVGEVSSSKKIFVGEETSTKLKINLNSKLANKKKEKEKYEKAHRWQKQGDIVIDTKLGLMWQDNSAAKSVKKKWKDAKKYCRNLTLAGHSDWYLPSHNELITLVTYDRYKPAIVPSFKYVTFEEYWSKDEAVHKHTEAWFVLFRDGYSYSESKSDTYFVRCLRKL